ncbi:S-adenosyl-L-methionine-dependent methyltransferase [Phycomyces nitens]|nr:S-adenosyl-L-methionine-dependent methyltransferase [Phycomyces nitens]
MLSRVEKALPENATILDVGCGSGSWVMDMAIDYPNARVTGLDIMDMFPAMIRPENVTFELANVLDGIPYPDSSFDFVHMRLMISAFRKEEWPFVITEIRRVLKPGGLAQFFESDFTYKGQSPAIDSLISELLRLMEERGQNPWVASQLGEMLKEKAFDHIELDQRKIDYADTVNPISREMLWNWKNVFMSLKPFLNEHLNATSQEYEEIVKQFAKECHQYGWSVNVLGYFAHKPLH